MATTTKLKEWPASTQLSSTIFDTATQSLVVVFMTGGIYQYNKVPEKVWNELLKAESAGKFLNANIKGTYEVKKLL